MEKEKQLQENYSQINRISVKCMRIVIYLLLIYYVLLFFNNKYDIFILTITFVICIVVAIIPNIVVGLLKIDKSRATKYVILVSTVVITIILITQLGSVAYPFMLFPILIASLYYNRTLVLVTSLLMSIGLFASAVFQVKARDIILHHEYSDVAEALTDMAVPNMVIVMCMSFVAYFIVDRNAMMINQSIDTAITMVNNQKGLIYSFAEISESKSKFTGEHIKRVAEYMRVLGKASGFDDDYVDKLATASMMHDIGKLMISEEILDKPSKLTDEEYQIMKNHVLYGDALLEKCPGEMMHLARILAKEHHERWDGSGYLGMKGEEISYIARLMAVCDVFDALTSDRYYKKGWSLEDTYNEIIRLSGKHFDPKVVRLFIKNFDKFKEIHDNIPDKQKY